MLKDKEIIEKYSHLTPFDTWEEAMAAIPGVSKGKGLQSFTREEQLNLDRYALTAAIERQKLDKI